MVKDKIQALLDIELRDSEVSYQVIERYESKQFSRALVSYLGTEDDEIRAYLFTPVGQKIKGGVLVHHQHNGERHWGKSEVAGLLGDEFQHFCPALAAKGIVCIAPDSICFEDRRKNQTGTEPAAEEMDDWLQHYNEMCYRLLMGTLLMKKVIEDSSIALSLLTQLPNIPQNKIGILGHSYGGNTVLFHTPFDERIKYACSSGAACSYKQKMAAQTGIEMAEVIPGFSEQFDIDDLLQLNEQKEMLIISTIDDQYAADAEKLVASANKAIEKRGTGRKITYSGFSGEHALNQERFDFIIEWFCQKFAE